MKKLIPLLILTLWALTGLAQRQFQKPLRSETSGVSKLSGNYYLGMKIGCPWSILMKSDLQNSSYDGRWGALLGISGERYFQHYSLGFDAFYAQRGTKMHRENDYQISFQENGKRLVNLTAAYDVAALRVPFTYYLLRLDKKAIPYLFIAPELDVPLPKALVLQEKSWLPTFGDPIMVTNEMFIQNGDTITQSRESTISPRLNVSAVAGAGMLVQVNTGGSTMLLKFDVGLNIGLMNQATDADKKLGTVILSHSIEACATILFRLKKPLRDACHTFER